MPTRLAAAGWVALLGLTAAGCGSGELPEPAPLAPLTPTTTEHPAFDPGLEPAEAVLSMVPTTAEVLTVTDWDAIRVQLGHPELTSQDLMSDRTEFWSRAEAEAPLLTDGMLRADASELMLDHGFTQDDVDWEAHWTGPEGNGFALRLRPDLPMSAVQGAVTADVGPLAGARVLAADHLVVSGTAREGDQVWANEPSWAGLLDEPAVATYARRGCIPVLDALGPDADDEDLARVRAAQPVSELDELPAFGLAFGDHVATVWTEPGRRDLFSRRDVGRNWPRPEFGQAFRDAVADPTTGRIGYTVPRPPQAARLALLDELPFAVCDEDTQLPDPSDL